VSCFELLIGWFIIEHFLSPCILYKHHDSFYSYLTDLGGQDSLVDKALDYRPKGTGFDPRLDHKKGAQLERLKVSPCEII
jgi:hypothetical protein